MFNPLIEREKSYEVENEGRQMGAMLLVVDEKNRLWVMRDVVKDEVVAGVGLPLYAPGVDERLNVPAGGRVGHEGVVETLERETLEETGVRTDMAERLELVSPSFMVVAQRKNKQQKKLHLIGVSVWMMRVRKGDGVYEAFSGAKDVLERKLGAWVPLEEVQALPLEVTGPEKLSGDVVGMAEEGVLHPYWMRPQLLMASRMLSGAVDIDEVQYRNQELVAGMEELAGLYGWEVVNGCMNPELELRRDEVEYLGVS